MGEVGRREEWVCAVGRAVWGVKGGFRCDPAIAGEAFAPAAAQGGGHHPRRRFPDHSYLYPSRPPQQPWDHNFAAIKAASVRQRRRRRRGRRRRGRRRRGLAPSWTARHKGAADGMAAAQVEVFAKNPVLKSCLQVAFKSCDIWPYNPEAVLAAAAAVASGAMSASVADVAEGAAVAAVGAAAAAALAAGGQLSGGISISSTLQRLEPTTGTAMVLVLLEAVNTEEVEAAAAVLRGERKRAPLRKPGKKRMWGFVTFPEWGGLAAAGRGANAETVEEAAERKAAAATMNKAAAAAEAAVPSTRHERGMHSRPQWAQQMPTGAGKQLPFPLSHWRGWAGREIRVYAPHTAARSHVDILSVGYPTLAMGLR